MVGTRCIGCLSVVLLSSLKVWFLIPVVPVSIVPVAIVPVASVPVIVSVPVSVIGSVPVTSSVANVPAGDVPVGIVPVKSGRVKSSSGRVIVLFGSILKSVSPISGLSVGNTEHSSFQMAEPHGENISNCNVTTNLLVQDLKKNENKLCLACPWQIAKIFRDQSKMFLF